MVVNAKGFCSANFAFGGSRSQQKKLEAEGLVFSDGHLDMKKYAINDEDFQIMRQELFQIESSSPPRTESN